MFKELFDSVVTSFNTSQFGVELRRIAREFSEWTIDSPQTPAQKSSESSREKRSAWSADEFKSSVYAAVFHRRPFSELPHSIDMQPLGYAMKRLNEQAQDGREYGRMCHIRLTDLRFEMGPTARGSAESVEIAYEHNPVKPPALMFHTHPPQSSNILDPCHLSPQDFAAFLKSNTLVGSIVVAPRANLMVIKTNKTPSFDSINPEYCKNIFDLVHANPLVPQERKSSRATQAICKGLNLGLYVHMQSSSDFIFHQINLKG